MVPAQTLDCETCGAPSPPCEIFADSKGWFVRTPEGETFGPFSAVREVEDWLDARDHEEPHCESRAK